MRKERQGNGKPKIVAEHGSIAYQRPDFGIIAHRKKG